MEVVGVLVEGRELQVMSLLLERRQCGEYLTLERRPDSQMSMTPMHMLKQMFEHSERPTSLHGIQ